MRALGCVCIFLLLTSCKGSQTTYEEKTTPTLKGSVVYRERIALPPGAELRVQLLDVSGQKIKPPPLSEYIKTLNQAPPYTFELPFQAADIQTGHHYAVKADILVGGNVMFSGRQRLKSMEPQVSKLIITAKRQTANNQNLPNGKAFTSRKWMLKEYKGTAFSTAQENRVPYLQFEHDGKLFGFTGCNQIGGKYLMNDRQIALRPATMTNRACFNQVINERDFLTTLKNVAYIKHADHDLSLLSTDKKPLAVFKEIPAEKGAAAP